MDKKTLHVIKGYSKLDYSQRKEFREFMKQFEDKEFSDRKPLVESLQKSLGPLDQDVCTCCGR